MTSSLLGSMASSIRLRRKTEVSSTRVFKQGLKRGVSRVEPKPSSQLGVASGLAPDSRSGKRLHPVCRGGRSLLKC
jgi:hypothetical protein